MFKMLLGAGAVVLLVGFGVLSTEDVQTAGNAAAKFVTEDVKPTINKAASSLAEATK
jgi:hypothetical protein